MTDTTETITIDGGDDAPFAVTATVTSLQRREEPGIHGLMVGLDAHLTVTFTDAQRSCSYFLSRLVGEVNWIIDAEFGSNGMPRHSNGFGARYLKVYAIAPELGDLLDREALRSGLAQSIGRGVPLVLADKAVDDDK
jgi:hypothetical protein